MMKGADHAKPHRALSEWYDEEKVIAREVKRNGLTKAERQQAYDSLINVRKSSAPTLIPLLVSEEDEIRQSATEILRKIGKPAVEPLATALGDADDRLKTRIMKVLDRMGYKPKTKDAAPKAELPRLT